MADLPRFDLTPEGVQAALVDLDKGGSEDVAERLAELGFKGCRGNDGACPVAVYMLTVVPRLEWTVVGGESAYVYGWRYDDLGMTEHLGPVNIPLPDSVSAFVEDFDQGCFPELVLAEEVHPSGA